MKNEKKVQQFLSRSARIGRRRRRIRRRRGRRGRRRRRNQQSLHLPEAIIEEVLSRLPVQSLLRLRCVSKSWGSLIGCERFIKTHHQNSIKNPSFPHQRVFLQKETFGRCVQCSLQSILRARVSPSPLADPTNTTLMPSLTLGCYNGLLCILDESRRRIELWNPSTRISKKLLEISSPSYVMSSGFGWVESSGEYKVFVLLVNIIDNDEWKRVGKVYSSKTKTWKTIEFCDDLLWCWIGGWFAGGKLYWQKTEDDQEDIIFLDLKSEVFGRIELPFPFHHNAIHIDDKYIVGVLGGCLCVLYYSPLFYYYQRGLRVSRVWVMKEAWEEVMTLSHLNELLQPPLVSLNGEILVDCGSILLVYNVGCNMFRIPGVCLDLCSHVYVESLVSPEDV
ncbi:F-box/kelch-repeat protein At3g23880-like [Salvia miltiorrhiza]|uniref:F-box/kelch-repeat protein At3g23880-like n=1 Tax=Salvia miltiorrhiza TaxID=226208 RepID=UPI0025AD827E|nr:F-box/kelch-repeat protein At3g23880-like [Salvia miltiorrhiza]